MSRTDLTASLTLATFPRVWTRPSKNGNHKVIVYSSLVQLCTSSAITMHDTSSALGWGSGRLFGQITGSLKLISHQSQVIRPI
jgi:hypothetical protein